MHTPTRTYVCSPRHSTRATADAYVYEMDTLAPMLSRLPTYVVATHAVAVGVGGGKGRCG